MKIKAEKYSFIAEIASANSSWSELKMLIKKRGANRITSQVHKV